ncbi:MULTISPECIES: HAD-IA family hydrolase [Sphingomonas]|uniref:HAD-IA family hydrolase n=1 Tax=Sphingomonas molluscorum TaxID=418184 RepID=A0ABU8Q8G5_9SPHN|nr:HAD-IA family hydrolase [Sphingomonas sp. JUb134]MBM7407331.1 phosphoglycolate phosphatase [Sphingomonas sp. JUb134]
MTRLAVFDCDGTLVDSQANICRAMELAFGSAQLPLPDRAAIRRIVGLSLVEAVARLAPDVEPALHASVAEDYKRHFRAMRTDGGLADEPLFDGVRVAIERLLADGWLLGVATGKSDRGLALILEHHGFSDHFVTLQTADRHPSKPHPSMLELAMTEAGADPENTVMIGDTSFDIAMAAAAGVHPIGVAWGYHTVAELTAAGARHVLDHASALPALADTLCPLPVAMRA